MGKGFAMRSTCGIPAHFKLSTRHGGLSQDSSTSPGSVGHDMESCEPLLALSSLGYTLFVCPPPLDVILLADLRISNLPFFPQCIFSKHGHSQAQNGHFTLSHWLLSLSPSGIIYTRSLSIGRPLTPGCSLWTS